MNYIHIDLKDTIVICRNHNPIMKSISDNTGSGKSIIETNLIPEFFKKHYNTELKIDLGYFYCSDKNIKAEMKFFVKTIGLSTWKQKVIMFIIKYL